MGMTACIKGVGPHSNFSGICCPIIVIIGVNIVSDAITIGVTRDIVDERIGAGCDFIGIGYPVAVIIGVDKVLYAIMIGVRYAYTGNVVGRSR